jgi:murein L,D-transpeptidase YafK
MTFDEASVVPIHCVPMPRPFGRSGLRFAASIALVVLGAASASAEPLHVVVWKERHRLEVIRDGGVVRTYRVSLGVSPIGPKEHRGDGKTPVGRYWVYQKRPSDRFRWFLALSYPSSDDADRAFDAKLIDADTWADIWLAAKQHEVPPWNTPLGGFVGIHGTGATGRKEKLRLVSDWTDGCVAVSDHDIDELYAMIPVGTVVDIRE